VRLWKRRTAQDKRRESDELGEEFVAGAWDTQLLLRLAREARPQARLFAGTFAVLAALFVLELAGPWILRSAIDGPVADALAARAAGGAYASGPFLRGLLWWGTLYVGCSIFTVGLRYLEVAQLTRAGQVVIANLRTRVFAHVQSMDLAWFDARPTGSLVTRVTTDIENLSEMYTTGLVTLLFDLVRILILIGILFVLDVELAVVVLALMPLLIGISLAFRGGARDAHRTVRARLSKLNGYLQEVLSGIRVVHVFRQERKVSDRFAGLLDQYLAANIRTIFLFALFFPALDLVVNGVQGATVWVAGGDIASGALRVGVFFQFWFYVTMLLNPVRELGERYNVLQSAFASAERVFQVLDSRGKVRSREHPAAVRARDGHRARGAHVRFEGVDFAYRPGTKVLEDVSFEMRPGETVAVVGATGAGKSTLVNLLLRFYDPSSGRILVDGVELGDWDLTELRRQFGLVLQEDFLFAGSVRDNLALGREEVTEESLELALEASRAERVVAALPGGLASPIAERGATLSTGERQLLAIARALAGTPRIVVLDEATASVDSNTEAQIEQAKANLLEGRTALVIAHRLSTVRRADRILVMHHGRLREQGTHNELLARDGLYARLYRMQFAEA
jgi:ATP-binding cassette subfamily B protein